MAKDSPRITAGELQRLVDTHTLHQDNNVCFSELWGHSIGVMFLYCTNRILYCPTPTLHLTLPLTGNFVHFYFLKKKKKKIISLLKYGDMG